MKCRDLLKRILRELLMMLNKIAQSELIAIVDQTDPLRTQILKIVVLKILTVVIQTTELDEEAVEAKSL